MITAIETGTRRASARTMVALAEALEIDPSTFAEYRLAIARHLLNEEHVGLEAAIKNLERSNLEPIAIEPAEIRRFFPARGRSSAERKAAEAKLRAKRRQGN